MRGTDGLRLAMKLKARKKALYAWSSEGSDQSSQEGMEGKGKLRFKLEE